MINKDLEIIRKNCSKKDYYKITELKNDYINKFIARFIKLLTPKSVFVCDDSKGDFDYIRKKALDDGEPIALILLDIMMPNMDGHEALSKIREIEKERNIPEHNQCKVLMTTAVDSPASMERARRTIQRTNGIVIAVTDDEIMAAKAEIDRVGIGCEPASAASLAGVRKLVASGQIARDASVVGILTGHVLKDADAVATYHPTDVDGAKRPNANRPLTIPAELQALERVIHGEPV